MDSRSARAVDPLRKPLAGDDRALIGIRVEIRILHRAIRREQSHAAVERRIVSAHQLCGVAAVCGQETGRNTPSRPRLRGKPRDLRTRSKGRTYAMPAYQEDKTKCRCCGSCRSPRRRVRAARATEKQQGGCDCGREPANRMSPLLAVDPSECLARSDTGSQPFRSSCHTRPTSLGRGARPLRAPTVSP